MEDWYPSLDERAPGRVVLLNGQQPTEMTVLQVGDRVIGASGHVRVTFKVLDVPGTRVYCELETLEPDLPAYRQHWADGDTWWLPAEFIHEVCR